MSMYSVNSILVAGQYLAEQSFDGHQEAVQNALREVLNTFCLQSQKVGAGLRLLTGFIDDHSSKFWEIDVVAESVEVRFGKIGTKGQIKITDFEMPPEALSHAEKKINEKLKEGYVEVSPTVDHPSTLIVDDKS